MTIQHKSIANAELHEPKDISLAGTLNGHIYIANGGGSGTWAPQGPANLIYVNALSDLPTASGGFITLVAKTTYLFGADVNIGTDFLLFANGTSVQSHAAFTASITYTGTSPMLQGADANARIKEINLSCANSEVYSWADTGGGGTSVLIVSEVLVISCTGIGTFNNVNTIVIQGSTVLDCDTGLVILGTNTGSVRMESMNIISTSATFVGLDVTGSVMQSLFIDGSTIAGGAGSIGIKGDAASANITTGFIANVSKVQFQGVTTPLSGITVDDIRYSFQGNGGLSDTMPDALLSMSANATATTLSVGVPTLVAGTFVEERASHFTATTAGRATYNGEKDLPTPMEATFTIDMASGTNKSVRAYIAKNGTAIANSGHTVNISAGDPKQITVLWQDTATTTDFYEPFIENETDSVDATVIDCTFRIR